MVTDAQQLSAHGPRAAGAGRQTHSAGARCEPRTLTYAAAGVAFCLLAAGLISWQPLQLSVATVFLFAGPHNLAEFRYFLARLPARWGRSRNFFVVGLAGVALLTVTYALLYAAGQAWYLSADAQTFGVALWETALVLWLCVLVNLRGRRRGRDRTWVYACGFALCAGAWVAPLWFGVALVYLHPLVALWFLDRQLKRTHPRWRNAYQLCLAALPVVLCLLWARLANAPDLPAADALAWRITRHAGAGLVPGVSSHLLVATHVFLETLHYGVWLVLLPAASYGARAWRVERVPVAVARGGRPRLVKTTLALGVCAVCALWLGFAADYATTRDLYFTLAVAHVLAEAPFLIRLL